MIRLFALVVAALLAACGGRVDDVHADAGPDVEDAGVVEPVIASCTTRCEELDVVARWPSVTGERMTCCECQERSIAEWRATPTCDVLIPNYDQRFACDEDCPITPGT